jgi:hypothetical protein
MRSFSIDGTLLRNISTGENGGAVFVNVTQFSSTGNSYIRNVRIEFCSAVYGGGIYIAQTGLVFNNINFTNNTAINIGSDIYENKTSTTSFYTSASTVQLCCSDSEGLTFGLSDNTDKSSMMPACVPASGERYLGLANGYDLQNSCLNEDAPCLTLANAILGGQSAMEDMISVTVIGEFEDSSSIIPVNEYVHIHSGEGTQSVYS